MAITHGRYSSGRIFDEALYIQEAVPNIRRPFHSSSKQAARLPEEQADRRDVDEEGTELRHPVLARGVADADDQRAHERAAQVSLAADRDHDQEVDELLEGIGRRHRHQVRAERAAERGEAAAEREGEREELAGVD